MGYYEIMNKMTNVRIYSIFTSTFIIITLYMYMYMYMFKQFLEGFILYAFITCYINEYLQFDE